MLGRFFGRADAAAAEEPAPEPFSFPEPLPTWPPGGGFARGRICVGGGELELAAATSFDKICALSPSARQQKSCGVTFYRPAGVPEGFSVLGHYCQPNSRPLHGHLLVARAAADPPRSPEAPPLCAPRDYELVWAFHASGGAGGRASGSCPGYGRSDAYFWLPVPPEGYRALGFLVTTGPGKPPLDDVRCVRADLTDECEPHGSLLRLQLTRPSSSPPSPGEAFAVRGLRPLHRGMREKGIGAGTFCCAVDGRSSRREQGLACLKNVDFDLTAMPTLEQVHAIIQHYGPTLFFHPKEIYLPSSVSWYFKNGVKLFKKGGAVGEEIDAEGSNLPGGGWNDGEYWMDLPPDVKRRQGVCHGDIESAELYAHVKPAMGGACTDVAMWVFCPFNGPARFKVGMASVPLGKTGQHVGDWEHFTLRVSNFTGELMAVYYSQHSGGRWVDASALEYVAGNKPAVYSSRNGHASYPYAGVYLQGSAALGIGILNDAARSNLYVDSSVKYRIVSAEYLGDGVVQEPQWLQFMREWGPTVIYTSKTRMEGMNKRLPLRLSGPAENMLNKMPNELSKEEGPTGPKEKNMWEGDERW